MPKTLKPYSVILLKSLLICACTQDTVEKKFDRLMNEPLHLSASSEVLDLDEPLRPLPEVTADSLVTPIVSLGRSLFHDTRLSGDGTIACANCHVINAGGDDGNIVSTGIHGRKGPINSPTVLNSKYNFKQFWDGRVDTLAEQANLPVVSSVEMGANWDDVVATLSNDETMQRDFKNAFGSEEITQSRIVEAIARYEESLITPAPFDEYLRGRTNAISTEAIEGYEKFKEYGCASCHQGINVGGNLFQQFGVMHYVDIDSFIAEGATPVIGERTGKALLVKVPSLRNIELTAPYFHTGSVSDLSTAIRIMGLSQLALTIPDNDVKLIKAFLLTLTGDWQQHAALVDGYR